MSMKKEDYQEFKRQLELQNSLPTVSNIKTKKDEDGTEYEWDEEKKAWFPKLSTDLMIKFQSSYYAGENEQSSKSSYHDPLSKITYDWDSTENCWKPRTMQYSYPDKYRYTNPQTGETYIWNSKEQQWSLSEDNKVSCGDNYTDAESANNCDLIQSNEQSYINKDGVYIHPDTKESYTWDQAKQVWISEKGDILYPSQWNYNQNYTDSETGKSYKWDILNQTWKEITNEKQKKAKTKSVGTKRVASKPEWFKLEDEKNTNIYVSGLPLDITNNEFLNIVSKCGIIATHPITNESKIKLYLDEEGRPKGDGRCCYLKRESVTLAMQILDGMDIRGSTLKVQEAQFELKGNYDASKKPKMLSKKEKKKIQKDQEKRLDWKLNRVEEHTSKTDRVVIFKKMFEVSEFEEDPVLITEIRDDLRNECEKFGPVKKVIVFDRHPDGVCSVAFQEVEDALKCQKALDGRWFACKAIEALIWDGVTDYQIEETDLEREERLKKWEQFLDGSETKKADATEVNDETNEATLADSKD